MSPKDENILQLIERCKKNDKKAQSEIYNIYSPLMFSVCLRYAGCYADAQDAFQEGFVRAFQKIHQFSGDGAFEGWLRRLMVNKCMDKFRKNKMTIISENPYKDANVHEIQEETVALYSEDELLAMIQQLPDQYRLVFNLYVIDGYTHAQIGEELGISEGTSKSNLSRAKSWLRNELKKKLVKEKIVINA